MDEYLLEIENIRRTLNRLKVERAQAALIEEYELEVRNLTALYEAAQETHAAGERDRRLPEALANLGFGAWTLTNVYSFVYDVVMDVEVGDGGIAQEARQTDFAGTLLASHADA